MITLVPFDNWTEFGFELNWIIQVDPRNVDDNVTFNTHLWLIWHFVLLYLLNRFQLGWWFRNQSADIEATFMTREYARNQVR